MSTLLISKNNSYSMPSMHDGYLLGLILDDQKQLEIRLQTIAGQRIRIHLADLLALYAGNFRQGNIVLGIDFFDKTNCPLNLLRKAFGYDEAEWTKHGSARLKEIEALNWSLVEVQESYGCEVYALSGVHFASWRTEEVSEF